MFIHAPNKPSSWSFVATVVGVAFAAGCASTSARPVSGTARAETTEHADHTQGDPDHGMMHGMGMCPMKVPGTVAAVTDVEGGVAISFTTSTGEVAELRRRVRHMAGMHERHQGMMNEREGMMGARAPSSAGGGMKMVPSTATVTDIDGGARVVLVPKDPAQLAELRQHARDHASMMARGECAMMAVHGQEPSEGR